MKIHLKINWYHPWIRREEKFTCRIYTWQYHLVPKHTLFKTVTSSMSCSTHVTSTNLYCSYSTLAILQIFHPEMSFYFIFCILRYIRFNLYLKNPHSKKSKFQKIQTSKNPNFKNTHSKNPHLKKSTFQKSKFEKSRSQKNHIPKIHISKYPHFKKSTFKNPHFKKSTFVTG